jgi:putative DNA primase/helicase
VLVVYHLNKGASDDPLLRHEASAAFTQIVRGSLMLGHDPDDPEGEAGDQRVLAVALSNLAPKAPSLLYRIETRVIDGDTGVPIETARMVEIGESTATARQLLGSGEQSERDAACAFLAAELEDGPVPTKELQQRARDAGIAWRTLERAKSKMGVEARRSGAAWEWLISSPPTPSGEGAAMEGLAELNPALGAGLRGVTPSSPPTSESGGLGVDTSDFEPAPAHRSVFCGCPRPAPSPRAQGPDQCMNCRRPIPGPKGLAS